MAYCISGCIAYDELSGLMTINQDPEGGLECTSDGQRIRIAGNTSGIAASSMNNGLFFTTAGELATLKTPQRKDIKTAYTGVSIMATNVAAGTYGPYAATSTLTFTNTSDSHPMLVVATFGFNYAYQIRSNATQNGKVTITPFINVNGVNSQVDTAFDSLAGTATLTALHKQDTLTYYGLYNVAAGSSLTLASSQYWVAAGTNPTGQDFTSAYCSISAYGLIAPVLA